MGARRWVAGMVDSVDEMIVHEAIVGGGGVHLQGEHVRRGKLLIAFTQRLFEHFVNALCAVGRAPLVGEKIGITIRSDASISRGDDPGWRIEDAGKIVEGNVTTPFVSVVIAGNDREAIARAADGDGANSLVADVAFGVRVDDILRSATKIRESRAELLPVFGGINLKETQREGGGIVDSPF